MLQESTRPPDRVSALILGAGSLLMLPAMAHHPAGIAHSSSVDELVRGASVAAGVHGTLIALMILVAFALLALVDALGSRSRRVRLGLLAYAFGTVLLTGAAVVSGFVTPRLALALAGAAGLDTASEPALRLAWETNQALAQTGSMALAAAVALWSAVLVGRDVLARCLGVLGLVLGIGIPGALVTGAIGLDRRGMGSVLVALTVWNLGVAVWLFRGAGGSPSG